MTYFVFSSWLAVDMNGMEWVFSDKPKRNHYVWYPSRESRGEYCWLPGGTIEKLIGRKLTWEDEPVKLSSSDEKN